MKISNQTSNQTCTLPLLGESSFQVLNFCYTIKKNYWTMAVTHLMKTMTYVIHMQVVMHKNVEFKLTYASNVTYYLGIFFSMYQIFLHSTFNIFMFSQSISHHSYIRYSGMGLCQIYYITMDVVFFGLNINIFFYFEMNKGGGTSEALKLKLHLNSEVYKRGNFHDFGQKKGKFF